ncbi:hypothetical protein BT93_H1809 [Corymbia citriodora subsp. variegata]|nr:hypothetical protein BT93_H1809 [Corymbia citriodora subsp. variegata]
MSVPRHHRYPSAATLTVLTFLLLVSAAAAISVTRQAMMTAAGTNKSPRATAASNHRITHNSCPLAEPPAGRRLLAGPGSSPPKCKGKCGWCKPCKAERVPIHPRVGLQAEYYPEVWFCKCGNKLFKP